jgi:copper homeostasis protein
MQKVLTSGLAATAPDGFALLKELVAPAGNRISIMHGAGIRSGNIGSLLNQTGALECHTSARPIVENKMSFSNPFVNDAVNFYLAEIPTNA